jgi:hypothetical protein
VPYPQFAAYVEDKNNNCIYDFNTLHNSVCSNTSDSPFSSQYTLSDSSNSFSSSSLSQLLNSPSDSVSNGNNINVSHTSLNTFFPSNETRNPPVYLAPHSIGYSYDVDNSGGKNSKFNICNNNKSIINSSNVRSLVDTSYSSPNSSSSSFCSSLSDNNAITSQNVLPHSLSSSSVVGYSSQIRSFPSDVGSSLLVRIPSTSSSSSSSSTSSTSSSSSSNFSALSSSSVSSSTSSVLWPLKLYPIPAPRQSSSSVDSTNSNKSNYSDCDSCGSSCGIISSTPTLIGNSRSPFCNTSSPALCSTGMGSSSELYSTSPAISQYSSSSLSTLSSSFLPLSSSSLLPSSSSLSSSFASSSPSSMSTLQTSFSSSLSSKFSSPAIVASSFNSSYDSSSHFSSVSSQLHPSSTLSSHSSLSSSTSLDLPKFNSEYSKQIFLNTDYSNVDLRKNLDQNNSDSNTFIPFQTTSPFHTSSLPHEHNLPAENSNFLFSPKSDYSSVQHPTISSENKRVAFEDLGRFDIPLYFNPRPDTVTISSPGSDNKNKTIQVIKGFDHLRFFFFSFSFI